MSATGLIGFGPGVSDQIAWEAHIGGFFAGFFGRLVRQARRCVMGADADALEMHPLGARCSAM